jgi:hypothetical protein
VAVEVNKSNFTFTFKIVKYLQRDTRQQLPERPSLVQWPSQQPSRLQLHLSLALSRPLSPLLDWPLLRHELIFIQNQALFSSIQLSFRVKLK